MSEFDLILKLYPLRGVVKHYDWGGYERIPSLLNEEVPASHPCAELWMGSHSEGSSKIMVDDAWVDLPEWIARDPEGMLGPKVIAKWGWQLPYLFKILDARQMLSIQAHPTLEQAQEGYAAENAAGISRIDANRNYKDRNHKPEVHVALTDFWMLHGFRRLEAIVDIFESVEEFRGVMPTLRDRLENAGGDQVLREALLRDLYGHLMSLPQNEVDGILDPLIRRLESIGHLDKDQPEFWIVRAAREFAQLGGHRDRGIFSIYLLNLVRLKPGESTYQSAGTLHAYLEGVNVELMANSDNVLRGGLTSKHVDVSELMKVVRFDDGDPEVIRDEGPAETERVFTTPAEDFQLSRISLDPGQVHGGGMRNGPDILIVTEGAVVAHASDQRISLHRGEIFFAPYAVNYTLEAGDESTVVFRATTAVV